MGILYCICKACLVKISRCSNFTKNSEHDKAIFFIFSATCYKAVQRMPKRSYRIFILYYSFIAIFYTTAGLGEGRGRTHKIQFNMPCYIHYNLNCLKFQVTKAGTTILRRINSGIVNDKSLWITLCLLPMCVLQFIVLRCTAWQHVTIKCSTWSCWRPFYCDQTNTILWQIISGV